MTEIRVKQIKVFNIKINKVDFGEFKVESEWEGFKKIVNNKGNIAIITGSLTEDLLGVSFGTREYNIVKASPDMIMEIKNEINTPTKEER